ncbi:MAG TPA: MFS transporter [Terriglobia bacterium]|nr:MFS transporter [Terriglobia bacterium]
MKLAKPSRMFYGWWIVAAAFLNLFLTTGIVYYGFPVFYLSLTHSLGFSRQQATSGIFFGFVLMAPLFGILAGALIDRVGARAIILCGIGFAGLSLVFMGMMSSVRQYYLLCLTEVIGYVLAGPIPNQVLIANWFRALRGRAMGYAYLGLGLGGAVSPVLIHWLIEDFGWRRAFETIGVAMLVILFPVGIWITRSSPREMGLIPDGAALKSAKSLDSEVNSATVRRAVRTWDFWLLLVGSALTIGAIGTVISHFILFLTDAGHSAGWASRALSILLISSLAGRVIVGYLADRFTHKNVMALFYLVLALAIPILFIRHSNEAIFAFAVVFGFAMGADYMLIPLVTADCFGLAALGKLLALIIMADSLLQTSGPVLAAHIFDTRHSYNLAWEIITVAGLLGALAIYLISTRRAARATSPAAEITQFS